MKKIVRNLFSSIAYGVGVLFSLILSYRLVYFIKLFWNLIYTAWVSINFKRIGKNSVIGSNLNLINGKYISIGSDTHIGTRVVLNAWDKYGNDTFRPEIVIGDNASIGDDSHITAINYIRIGNNVLMGKKITITDNSHGVNRIISELNIPPISRALYSKGGVVIEDNVWIGDKVTILPGVRIGFGSIVGANSVVTKDIPPNCIVGGIPAMTIKELS